MGQSSGEALNRPLVNFVNSHDGAISEDEQIIGTYLHGLFDEAEALQAMLSWAGLRNTITSDYRAVRISNIDRIADAMEVSLNLEATLSQFATEQIHF
ncbi:MAG: hypothetical protein HC888_14555 [Candidatus Competibacteraceae bacterium]|nr:hypothetical protein [Candidatus Competibacteraceae bacterium]